MSFENVKIDTPIARGDMSDGDERESSMVANDVSKLNLFLEKHDLANSKFVSHFKVTDFPHFMDFARENLSTSFPSTAFWQGGHCHEDDEVREIMTFFKIWSLEVDMVGNTFEVTLESELYWKPSYQEVKSYLDSRDTNVNDGLVEFIPELMFLNSKSVHHEIEPHIHGLRYDTHDHKFYLYQTATYKIVLHETYDLQNFPFDCQDLLIRMALGFERSRTVEKLRMIPLTNSAKDTDFVVLQTSGFTETDWNFEKATIEFLETSRDTSIFRFSYPVIHLHLKISRRFGHYFWRICFILALVALSSCIAFTLDIEDDFADSAAYLSTSLLTVVAFMFVVSSTLPAIPYLTILDHYVYSLLVFVAFQMFFLALCTSSVKFEANTILWVSLTVWVLIQIVFGIVAAHANFKEKKKLDMNSKELEELYPPGEQFNIKEKEAIFPEWKIAL